MASVVLTQRSPALTPTGGPPSSSPFVPAPDSSPYSRPHPPTTRGSSNSHFPGSYPSETQLKEPKDAIDDLADAAPLSGGSVLPAPGVVMQGVQSVLAAVNETAKAYLPASIGNALPVGTTDPNVIETETQNPSSYAVPSDLPTASSTGSVVAVTSTPSVDSFKRTDILDTDVDANINGGQINNATGVEGVTSAAGVSRGVLDRDASTRSLAPSSIQGGSTTTSAVTAAPLAPDFSNLHSTSSYAPTPLPKDSNIQIHDTNPEVNPDAKVLPLNSHLNESKSAPSVPVNDDAASSTISDLGSSNVDVLSRDSTGSGASGTISDADENEVSDDDRIGNEKAEKKSKSKRFMQKMKGKLHMGH